MASSSRGARRGRGGLFTWFDERLGLSDWAAAGSRVRIPDHRGTLGYHLGGLALFFFAIQCVTGALLLAYYDPGAGAYESVRRITFDIEFGWLVRSVHGWSAGLMILCLVTHTASAGFMRAYRRPRELTWFTGLAMLALVVGLAFTGNLLPQDQAGRMAAKLALHAPSHNPLLGPLVEGLIVAGDEVGPATARRFFVSHVVVLPTALVILLVIHLVLVLRHGLSEPPEILEDPDAPPRSIPLWPRFLAKDAALWLVALNVVGLLAALWPRELGPPADPLAPAPPGIHLDWYLMAPMHWLRVTARIPGPRGAALGVGGLALVGILLVAAPWLDSEGAPEWRRKAVPRLGAAALALGLLLTAWGYLELWWVSLP
jgi:cytochrome b6